MADTLVQVVHGLSVPIGKLGYHLPRTLSTALGSNSRGEPASFQAEGLETEHDIIRQRIVKKNIQRDDKRNKDGPARTVFGVGGAVIHTGLSDPVASAGSSPVNTPTFLLSSRSRDDLERNESSQGQELPRSEGPPQSRDSPQSKESSQNKESPQNKVSPQSTI